MQRKPINSYPNQLLHFFNIITFNEKYNIRGSSSKHGILYPVDFDLNMNIYDNNDTPKAIKHITKMFKSLFLKIKSNPDIFFKDFKIGIDEELYFENYENLSMYNNYLKRIFDKNLITRSEYNTLKKLENAEEIKDAVKNLYKLRWLPDEIIKGYKVLSNNRKKHLINSILDKHTIIKLDIVVRTNYGEFEDISNIYRLKLNMTKDENIKSSLDEVVEDFQREADEFYKEKKYFKYLKRLYSIASVERDYHSQKLLLNVLNSDLGLLYKVISTLQLYVELLSMDIKIDLHEIAFGIQNQKYALSFIAHIPLYAKIYDDLDDVCNLNKSKSMINKLNKIDGLLNEILEKSSIEWIKTNLTKKTDKAGTQ